MAEPPIILEDFICTICREIYQKPVSLTCSHAYCLQCLEGLKKAPSLSDSEPVKQPPISEPSLPTRTLIYQPQLHEKHVCYICAICRLETFGYFDCRELEADLKTLIIPCPNCAKEYILCELRKHLETCKPVKKTIDADAIKNIFSPNFFKQLSEPQAAALAKAQEGDNRSTFQCPYCIRANFTVEHLCKHMEKHHLDEHPSRVCPICASMPWGDRNKVSVNVYQHIIDRHRFDYSTYVNYEQDEESMLAEALERSMIYH